ncbi:hypothetical protein H8356DRAFT_1653288 [Neocallimastix lanati (nom. inval.)]|jgi:hypothetical protein|uniref:Uncharacterized protein n=1 Tax=Neocallimastix californiae TaxID=1754190 RepID=A0A1Y2F257_9FUNG|nr:hypothetical protein H8356DRAFT_1653288 [Neocallimastix sp. JGI-2020a]ORY77951.1 hypothetical protein LY90DRAFT_665198 [Neocallimastix californiae]|eukprot:ORY77951.1 hypothetical protein LY90DRAFT_665198 [Neocallimastix californiae]
MVQEVYDHFYGKYGSFTINKIDNIQKVILPFITSPFFPWICLIFLLNKKNWKRPVILVLIGHWLFRAIGDLLRNTMELRNETSINTYWPYTKTNWYVSNGIAHVFWLLGEIMGDWYPLLRTKAVTNNSNKMKTIFITCIIFNITKVFGMYTYFMDMPIDLRVTDENGNKVKDIIKFNIYWWTSIGLMQISSCIYDISVITALKTCLFNKLKEYKNFRKNTFLDKFKQISELRIILSMVISLIFLPFLILFVVSLIREYRKSQISSFTTSSSSIEQLRQVVLSFNFTVMYIDQILLKSIANKKNISKSRNCLSNNASSSSVKTENSLTAINQIYKNTDNTKNSPYLTQSEINKFDVSILSSTSLTALTSPNSALTIVPTNYSYTNTEDSNKNIYNSNYYLENLQNDVKQTDYEYINIISSN